MRCVKHPTTSPMVGCNVHKCRSCTQLIPRNFSLCKKCSQKHCQVCGRSVPVPEPEGPAPQYDSEQERAEDEAESKCYRKRLVESGQAAVPDAHGQIPPNATHAILGYEDDGTPVLQRRKYL